MELREADLVHEHQAVLLRVRLAPGELTHKVGDAGEDLLVAVLVPDGGR